MKKGFQLNQFLIVYLVIVVLGVGGLGYFLYQSKGDLDAATEEYQTAVQRLHTLQTRKPFPDEKNLKQLQELQSQYKSEIKSLADDLKSKELPLKEITPQIFQDRLRQIVTEIGKKAAEQNVQLPQNFYMGFDRYKDSLPQPQAATPLGRQLESITIVVNKLLDIKVREIVSVSRKELPSETATAPEASKKVVTLSPFNIIFVSDQGKFRQVFNSILDANQFFIIRNLAILNSKPFGPSRKEDHPDTASTPAGAGLPNSGLPANTKNTPTAPGIYATPAKRNVPLQPAGTSAVADNGNKPQAGTTGEAAPVVPSIRVVVGQETLTVALQIDQVDFEMPEIK